MNRRKRVFLTGSSGFLGGHVERALKATDVEVYASTAQLQDTVRLCSEIEQGEWDCVLHFAGLSAPGDCEKDSRSAFDTNLVGTVELARNLGRIGFKGLFAFASTSQVYALHKIGSDGVTALKEDFPTGPTGVYGQSKLFAEQALQSLAAIYGMNVLCLRLFNHTHKSQRPDFFLPYVHGRLSKTAPGEKLVLPVGNVDLFRDFGTARDLTRAFVSLVGKSSDVQGFQSANLCSGQPRQLRTLAVRLAQRMEREIELRIDSSRVRADEPKNLSGSGERLKKLIGWKATSLTDDEFISSFLEDL